MQQSRTRFWQRPLNGFCLWLYDDCAFLSVLPVSFHLTQPSTSTLSCFSLFFSRCVTKGESRWCDAVSAWGESWNPAVSVPLPLNEHVQSTHSVPLKPDHINLGLNFKGQVPFSAAGEENMELLKQRTSHCRRTPQLIHLTPRFCCWTTHHSDTQRPHTPSHKSNKRSRKTSQRVLTWFDRTPENPTPVAPQTAK